ncbi:MAG: arsenate reductase ArsC [Anaerorhabdus sp.]
MKVLPKVAFVCVHNSCRSQIAEALGKHLANYTFESFSAGTEVKDKINQDAVRLVSDIYGINMEETQYSKLLSDIPQVDIVITMGCNVSCPTLPCKYREDWGLEDPSGKSDEEYIKIIEKIHENILQLKRRIEINEIVI